MVSVSDKKRCLGCGPRYLHEFGRNTSKSDGLATRCRACNREAAREKKQAWLAVNPDYMREYRQQNKERIAKQQSDRQKRLAKTIKLKRYGLSEAEFEAKRESQAGRCAICNGEPTGRWKTLHIDHDHKTGQVRGLLCNECNTALGMFRDSADLLRKAAEYLEQYRKMFAHEAGPEETPWLPS